MRTAILVSLCATWALTAMAADPPRPSPPLAIERVGAPALDLSQYRGKVVALALISTTCPHCQELTRLLIPLSDEYAPRGVQVLECAFNDDAKQTIAGFVRQFQPPFPVGWTTHDAVMGYLQRSIIDTRPVYVPHMVFLDRRGMIEADYPGESDFFKDTATTATNIRAELEKLLKAPAK
ncbi:MAG: TlpA disulfide reductase family protein [Bryobacteraceae bacterium]|jgi:thiol-disulfide isomerase/thioredoxin